MQTYHEIAVGAERLAACLHRPADAPRAPIVVCCHGLTGTRVGSGYRFVALARRLADIGIACLRFDFRGCGESDGRFIDVTAARLVEDLQAVLGEIPSLGGCDSERLGIVASSFGAYTTSLVASRINGLRALVFLAPVASPKMLLDRGLTADAREFLRRNGWIDHHGLPLGTEFIESLPDFDAPKLLAEARKPLLVFHGSGDQEVPIEQGLSYVAALESAQVNTRMERFETKDHGMRSVYSTQQIVDGATKWMKLWI